MRPWHAVEELKTTVGWLHEKLARIEERVEDLEGGDEYVDAVANPTSSKAGSNRI